MNHVCKNIFLCFLVAGLLAPSARAEESEYGAWLIASADGALFDVDAPGHWRYSVQGQFRAFSLADGARQVVGRGGIGYRFKDRLTAWAGYAYFQLHADGVGTARENRTWQQVNWNMGAWNRAVWKSRTRLEQRFREGRSGTGWSLRQQLGVEMPLSAWNGVSLIFSDEVFFDLRQTSWVQTGFSQNRVFAGLGFKNKGSASLEAGYMHQYIRVRESPDLVNHLLILRLKW